MSYATVSRVIVVDEPAIITRIGDTKCHMPIRPGDYTIVVVTLPIERSAIPMINIETMES